MRFRTTATAAFVVLLTLCLVTLAPTTTFSQSPRGIGQRFANRGDIRHLPAPLKARLVEIAERPHTFEPITAFSEADEPSRLFQFYLVDTTGFQPNVFTATIPGINDGAIPTAANAANGGLPTIGAVRVTLEPKPGLPTDPNDPRAFIDVFMDFSGLFVINNESGWYEGWMISDVRVPPIAPPRPDGTAQFGKITAADAVAIGARGSGNNVPGHIFTFDGNPPRFGSVTDAFPDPARQPNTLPHPVSMGAFNAQQQSDVHAYWEFNRSTNWIFPHYELPFTGGVPGTFAAGLQYENLKDLRSVIPGSGPAGVTNDKLVYGDNPDNPRDPDRGLLSETGPGNPEHLEFRNRFIPSGLDQEVLLNAFVRVASFRPDVTDAGQRLFLSYAQEIARVDQNGDGVISFVEADVNGTSDGLLNTRLYLPPSAFNRFAVTREINDGLLAPRFAPFQRGYVLSGFLTQVQPSVPASVPEDADDR